MEASDEKILRQAALWIENYLSSVRSFPVYHQVQPGDIKASLPTRAPQYPESMEDVVRDIENIILPGITHWNHPRFMGYFSITGSIPGIAGEMIASALNVNAMLWRTSPSATELEYVAASWVADLLGLPPWFGLINDTASSSTFYALAAARHKALPDVRQRGLAGQPSTAIYCSDQVHSSIDKAAVALGIGLDFVRRIPTDTEFGMNVSALEESINSDVNAGIVPCAVIATVGTTAATGVDPIQAIGEICQKTNTWLHVDAAYAGAAAALPEKRWIFDGIESSDSLVVNPHKWLFVPIDCSLLYLKDPDATKDALSIVPDYLASREEMRNLMDYGVSLGRRFRSLKLWMTLRILGQEKIRQALRGHIQMADKLANLVETHPLFELVGPHHFSVVNLRAVVPDKSPTELDQLNEEIVESINGEGKAFVTTVKLDGRTMIHVAIGNLYTTESDVLELWEELMRLAESASHS